MFTKYYNDVSKVYEFEAKTSNFGHLFTDIEISDHFILKSVLKFLR